MTRHRSSSPATAAAIERAIAIAKDHGAKRAVLLPVSAPFHCPLMQPAADVMAEALGDTDIKAPAVPLYANVIAAPVTDPARIRELLVEQVTGMVRWRESIAEMRAAGSRNSSRSAARCSARWSSASPPTPGLRAW